MPTQSTVAIAVATAQQASAVREVLGERARHTPVRVVAEAAELGDGPVLVVGALAAALDPDRLAAPDADYLDEPYTPAALLRRLDLLERRAELVAAERARAEDFTTITRGIADVLRLAIMFYDADDRPILHNKNTEEVLALTGFDPATGLSKHVHSPDRRTPVKQDKNIITETLTGDERGIIYWIGDPDHDEQRAIITEAHPISRPDGSRLGTALIAYDVTDLANAIDEREDYLTTVSHELRTPLTAIVGYLDLIAESFDVAELGIQQEFAVIERNLDQLTALVNELSNSDTREQNLRREPADLRTVVSHSVAAQRPAARSARLELNLSVPSEPVIGLVDATKVRQVVDNIVSNAVKYTPSEGIVDIRLEHEGEDAVIYATNTGGGLTRSDQARIFDRFFRSDQARASATRGVGIGLAIAKAIVTAHGGTISVESTLGESTTFTVRLPLRGEGAPLTRLPERP